MAPEQYKKFEEAVKTQHKLLMTTFTFTFDIDEETLLIQGSYISGSTPIGNGGPPLVETELDIELLEGNQKLFEENYDKILEQAEREYECL